MNKTESKSEIEFSSSMTQNDVQKKIQETFPYLEYKRFSCAACIKVDNDHKKFEFHGSRHVWDGKTIKKYIKGKSNLYILEEEVVHSTSTVTHDSNSTESEDNNAYADARRNSSASDTGFDEGMDIDHAQQHEYWNKGGQSDIMSGNTETLDDIYGGALLYNMSHMGEVDDYQPDSADVTMSAAPEFQVSGEYSRTSVEELATSRTSEDNSEDLSQNHRINADLPLEVTMDPPRVPLQGGRLHSFDFKLMLPSRVQSGSAIYGNLGTRVLRRLENSLIGRSTPSKKEPGLVLVKLYSQSNEYLGEARLFYFNEDKECVKKVAQDGNLLRDLFGTLAISYGTKAENSRSETQNSGNLEGKHSGSTRPLQVLQLLVYAAAECGAQQCIKIILNSSAGRGVFDAYKDSSPLPEVIARENGHEEIADYLEDITTRFGNEKTICPEGSQTIDWAELVAAAEAAQEQRELSITSGEENHQVESDETSDTDYFADAETSSSDSSQLSRSDSEDADSEISSEGSVEEGEIQLKANVLEKHTDEKRTSSSPDFSDANIHREDLSAKDESSASQLKRELLCSSSHDSKGRILSGKDCGSTETNRASKTPKTRPTGSSFIEFLVTCFSIFILVIALQAQTTVITGTIPYHTKTELYLTVLCVLVAAATVMVCCVIGWMVMCILPPRVCFNNEKGGRKEEESTPGRPTSNNFQNQHNEANMIELRKELVTSWLASDLQKVPPSIDIGGCYNWDIVDEKRKVRDAGKAYKASETELRHSVVQRKDLAEKCCHS